MDYFQIKNDLKTIVFVLKMVNYNKILAKIAKNIVKYNISSSKNIKMITENALKWHFISKFQLKSIKNDTFWCIIPNIKGKIAINIVFLQHFCKKWDKNQNFCWFILKCSAKIAIIW